ncbi:UNVERIFIED_CONTAM: Histone-lysine N-methyltransferase SETMAR [Trichonephila clavipes]
MHPARLCFVSDGLVVKWFTMSCYQRAKRSMRTSICNTWNVYNRHCIRRSPALVNRTGVLLLHDNARPHVTWVARNTIQRLGWETLYHLPYSLDLAPSDYPLFRSLDNHLRGKSLTNEADVHQAVVITSRTNNRLCCLYVMFFWVIKNAKNCFVYFVFICLKIVNTLPKICLSSI